MASPYAAQLSRLSGLQGSNMASDYNRGLAAENFAKLEYKNELDRQRKAQRAAKEKHEGNWWKRGLGSAATGALTGALSGMALGPGGMLSGALIGAGAGAVGGFGASAINDKLMGGAMGDSFGMQIGQAAGAAGAGAYGRHQAQLGLDGGQGLADRMAREGMLAPGQAWGENSGIIGPGESYYNPLPYRQSAYSVGAVDPYSRYMG
jgi:hypothetical protein